MDKILEDLKKLKTIFHDTETVKLGDSLEVELAPISSEEETEAHAFALQHEQGLAYIYSVKRETVARSIIKINGKELPEYIEEDNGETLQRYAWLKKNIISGWNQMLIDKIWLGYSNLLNRLEVKINGETLVEKENSKENEQEEV